MDNYILIGIFILLGIFFYIATKSTKKLNSDQEYFFADRKLGVFAVTMSLVATQFGGNAIIGVAELSYKYGIYGILYSAGLSLGLIMVGFFTASILHKKEITTIAELFQSDYGSNFLRMFVSVLSIISMSGILVSLVVVTKKILYSFDIKNDVILYAVWAILILYTAMGGIKSVVYTDIFQLLAIVFIFVLILLHYSFYQPYFLKFSLKNLFVYESEIPNFSRYIIVPFLYVFIEQDMAQRFFSAKSSKTAYISALLSGVILFILSLFSVIFGVAARVVGDGLNKSSIFMYFFQNTAPNWIIVLIAIGLLCAVISTADSILCAISSNIASDFKRFNSLHYNRFITVIVGLCVIFIGCNYFDNVIDTVLLSYEFVVCILFLPVIIPLFSFFKCDRLLGYSSIILGGIGFFIHIIFNFSFSRVLFCLLCSSLSIIISIFYRLFILSKK